MNVHLVGSIGLDSVEEVFSTVGRLLGPLLKRIPDGEPGPRRLWVSFQHPLLRSSPYLRPDPSGEVRPSNRFPKLCLAEGVRPEEVAFGELGYARDLLAIDAAYERAMLREVQRICAAIPHAELCLQWDFCHEMLILDGQPQDHFPALKASMEEIMARMRRLCAAVPDGVELGVHLCYGDFGAHHILEPRDMRRMAAAKYAPRFGIACECGIARARKREMVRRVLEIHAEAARA